ncbi:MAG: hypothetical protein AB7O59_19970 [Pirellulales bacterium]
MAHLLCMQEGRKFGIPVWHFASARHEKVHDYAPRRLGDRKGEDDRSWGQRDKLRAYVRAFVRPVGAVDLSQFGHAEYALYLPRSKVDFNWLCKATATYGACIEIIVPRELTTPQLASAARTWATARPLRYLTHADLCAELAVPWVYLLGIYNYDPCLSVFITETEGMATEFLQWTEGVEDCYLIPLDDALATEQRNWEDIYKQFEEPGPLTPEQLQMAENFRKFKEKFERRYGE